MFSKLLNELKQNKYTTIVFCIFLVLFLIAWILYGMIMPSAGKPVYGNRLDGIEKVELTEKDTEGIVKKLEEDKMVNSASVHISGKIVNVLIEVKGDTKVSNAKKLSDIAIKDLEKEELAFYDIQVFITNEDKEAKGYPIVGYKSSSSKKFIF